MAVCIDTGRVNGEWVIPLQIQYSGGLRSLSEFLALQQRLEYLYRQNCTLLLRIRVKGQT
jgi:hypothetical protein